MVLQHVEKQRGDTFDSVSLGRDLRFEADEMIGRLTGMVDALVRREELLARSLEQERQRADRLAARLRSLGIDPDAESETGVR